MEGQFRYRSDARKAVERWGVEVGRLRRLLVGMFAFALWGPLRKKALPGFAIGLGKSSPSITGFVDGDFVFASELKAIRQYPRFAGQIDRDAPGTLHAPQLYSITRTPCTKGFCKLQPGCILILKSQAGASN